MGTLHISISVQMTNDKLKWMVYPYLNPTSITHNKRQKLK